MSNKLKKSIVSVLMLGVLFFSFIIFSGGLRSVRLKTNLSVDELKTMSVLDLYYFSAPEEYRIESDDYDPVYGASYDCDYYYYVGSGIFSNCVDAKMVDEAGYVCYYPRFSIYVQNLEIPRHPGFSEQYLESKDISFLSDTYECKMYGKSDSIWRNYSIVFVIGDIEYAFYYTSDVNPSDAQLTEVFTKYYDTRHKK